MAEKVKRTYTEDVALSMAIRHQLDRHLPPSGVMTWLSLRVQELEAQVAQLTHERDAARQGATFLEAQPEGQDDAG